MPPIARCACKRWLKGKRRQGDEDPQVAARTQAPNHLLRAIQFAQCVGVLPPSGILLRVLQRSLQRLDLCVRRRTSSVQWMLHHVATPRSTAIHNADPGMSVATSTSSASASCSPTTRWLYVATRWLSDRLREMVSPVQILKHACCSCVTADHKMYWHPDSRKRQLNTHARLASSSAGHVSPCAMQQWKGRQRSQPLHLAHEILLPSHVEFTVHLPGAHVALQY